MKKFHDFLVNVLLAAAICVCCALTWALTRAAAAAEQARVTIANVDAAVTDLRSDEQELRFRVLAPAGILDRLEDEQNQIRDVTRSARVTVDEVGEASIEQRHYWETELPLLSADVAGTLGQLRETIDAARPVEAEAAQTVRDLGQAVRDTDTRIASPQVTQMLDSGAAAAAQSAQAAANVNRSTADVANEVHGILHWSWPGHLVHRIRRWF